MLLYLAIGFGICILLGTVWPDTLTSHKTYGMKLPSAEHRSWSVYVPYLFFTFRYDPEDSSWELDWPVISGKWGHLLHSTLTFQKYVGAYENRYTLRLGGIYWRGHQLRERTWPRTIFSVVRTTRLRAVPMNLSPNRTIYIKIPAKRLGEHELQDVSSVLARCLSPEDLDLVRSDPGLVQQVIGVVRQCT